MRFEASPRRKTEVQRGQYQTQMSTGGMIALRTNAKAEQRLRGVASRNSRVRLRSWDDAAGWSVVAVNSVCRGGQRGKAGGRGVSRCVESLDKV